MPSERPPVVISPPMTSEAAPRETTEKLLKVQKKRTTKQPSKSEAESPPSDPGTLLGRGLDP